MILRTPHQSLINFVNHFCSSSGIATDGRAEHHHQQDSGLGAKSDRDQATRPRHCGESFLQLLFDCSLEKRIRVIRVVVVVMIRDGHRGRDFVAAKWACLPLCQVNR